MILKKTIKKMLAARGYKHTFEDDAYSLHGEYTRNIQYAFSKEHDAAEGRILDVITLSTDLHREVMVLGFSRENMSREKSLIMSQSVTIPLAGFSMERFEKQLHRLIPSDPVALHAATSPKSTF